LLDSENLASVAVLHAVRSDCAEERWKRGAGPRPGFSVSRMSRWQIVICHLKDDPVGSICFVSPILLQVIENTQIDILNGT